MLLPARSIRCSPPDVNAKIHEGESGRRLWAECVELGIESRKAILARCKLFRPFIPPVVDGKLWQDYPTSVLASDRRFFSFELVGELARL